MEHATIINADYPSEKIKCLFNPTEYAVAKSSNWSQRQVVGKNVPALTFSGGGGRTLTLELFFDVLEKKGNVQDYIKFLWKLTEVDERLKNPKTGKARPPLCIFQWGSHWSFKAAITSLSVRYTLFEQDGTPVRAVASVTFQEGEDDTEQPAQNPTSHSRQPGRRRREVRPHDTLALIAYEEYGDATRWRLIADENQIDDPLSLTPGMILAIPPL